MTKEVTFEESYKRLEEILEKINLGKVSLEDSILLYEEADKLIISCTEKIDLAEKKITTLMRKRDKELVLDESGRPLEKDF
jgi:exodeoxyribonuclease VII small subunit